MAFYEYSYFGENTDIWGVPLFNRTAKCLKKNGAAENLGGGIVALPLQQNPFVAGDMVQVMNTTSYNGKFVLQAQTTTKRLAIVRGYVPEIFDGDEPVARKIEGLSPAYGEIALDKDGNIYYGHNWNAVQETYITRIKPDGSIDHPLDNSTWLTWPLPSSGTCKGVVIQGEYLWTLITATMSPAEIQKWDLSTGLNIWGADPPYVPIGQGLALDTNGDAYNPSSNDGYDMGKYAFATGSQTYMTWMGRHKTSDMLENACRNATIVDLSAGLVIGGGHEKCLASKPEELLYNLALRKWDNSAGYQVALDGVIIGGAYDETYTIEHGGIATHGGFIYVLQKDAAGGPKLYKLTQDLTVVTTAAAPPHVRGIYFDPWGNLVAVNQDGTDNEIFWFYNQNLVFLKKLGGYLNSMLDTWIGSNVGFYPSPVVPGLVKHSILGVPRMSYAVNAKHVARRHETIAQV